MCFDTSINRCGNFLTFLFFFNLLLYIPLIDAGGYRFYSIHIQINETGYSFLYFGGIAHINNN